MIKREAEALVEAQLVNVFKVGMLEGLKTFKAHTDPIPVLKEAHRNIMEALNAKV